MKECKNCGNESIDRDGLYCSSSCCVKYNARERARERKRLLVAMHGGRCQECGYDKCIAALHFHHKDPSKKKFGLRHKNLASKKWAVVFEESKKCDLLCANCHAEHHHLEDPS